MLLPPNANDKYLALKLRYRIHPGIILRHIVPMLVIESITVFVTEVYLSLTSLLRHLFVRTPA
jgi:accessory gene regulator protein AgrB